MRSMLTRVFAICLLALFAAGSLPIASSHADQSLFAYTPSDHDPRCLIDLQNADRIELVTMQKKLTALPADCHARCPFRNISQFFYLTKIRGDVMKRHCLLHVTTAQTLASSGGDSGSSDPRFSGNIVVIYQDGSGNIVATYQNGDGNFSIVLQGGNGNMVQVTQQGNNNTAGIIQTGSNNNLNLTQNGNNNSFIGSQNGGDNLNLTQNGNQSTVSYQ